MPGYLQGLVKTTAVFTALTEQMNITQHYMKDVPAVGFGVAAIDALAGRWLTWWTTGLGGTGGPQNSFHPTIVNFARLDITEYTTNVGNGSPITTGYAIGSAGNGGTSVAPPTTALAITKRTAGSGARHRGRAFLGFLNNNNTTASSFNVLAASVDQIAENYAELLTAINAHADIDATAVVFSFAGQGVDPITSVAVGNQWDSMRSRRSALVETYTAKPVV